MIKLGISGAAGRMGTAIASLMEKEKDMQLVLGLEEKGHRAVGSMVCGCLVSDDLKNGIKGIDVFIDFSVPAATLYNLKILADAGKAAVVGTTGFNEKEIYEINAAAKKIPVVFSSNYSVGVNVMWKIVRDAVKAMKDNYDIDIVESHHRMKKDAPSGTAITTAKVITDAKGIDYEKNVIFGRSGRDNDRPRDQLGILAVRGGGVIGEHTVIMADTGDRLEIKHTAFSRETFAVGALKAARFIVGKKAGLYSMGDVLGL
jgi:4-hydroxy-tetrahydrodipicolinate reductase